MCLTKIGKRGKIMKTSKSSVKVSIGVCFVLCGALLFFVCFGPWVFEIYMTKYRGFLPTGEALAMLKTVFAAAFYPSAAFAAIILYSLLKLLFNIKQEKIFITENITLLRVVSWCCLVIMLITFVGGMFYMPFIFVALAGGFVGLMLRVLMNVMRSAVELREENDLTI